MDHHDVVDEDAALDEVAVGVADEHPAHRQEPAVDGGDENFDGICLKYIF